MSDGTRLTGSLHLLVDIPDGGVGVQRGWKMFVTLMHVGAVEGSKVVITWRMGASIRALVMTIGMTRGPGSTRRATNPVGNLTKLDITL